MNAVRAEISLTVLAYPVHTVHPVIPMICFPAYVRAGRLLTTDFTDGHGFKFLSSALSVSSVVLIRPDFRQDLQDGTGTGSGPESCQSCSSCHSAGFSVGR
jgi:hypothetical protein